MMENYTTVKFRGHDLNIRNDIFTNPLLRLMLSYIEIVDVKHGEGLIYYDRLKNNWKLEIEDKELDNQIRKILATRK
jgi:hypothetical protein